MCPNRMSKQVCSDCSKQSYTAPALWLCSQLKEKPSLPEVLSDCLAAAEVLSAGSTSVPRGVFSLSTALGSTDLQSQMGNFFFHLKHFQTLKWWKTGILYIYISLCCYTFLVIVCNYFYFSNYISTKLHSFKSQWVHFSPTTTTTTTSTTALSTPGLTNAKHQLS